MRMEKMLISLSILEYEPNLSENINNLEKSEDFMNILRLVQTGKISFVHIDVMRPPMIPGKIKFPISLVRRLYEKLHDKVSLVMHLMVDDPLGMITKINEFISKEDRIRTTIILQVEAFESEDEAIKAIETVKEYGYKVGVSLNLLTPESRLTDKVVNNADMILLMTVPMGSGRQTYDERATERIRRFSKRFPDKIIEVDGGINHKTIVDAWRAGAKAAVVGSYITASENPEKALRELERVLGEISEA